MTAGLISKRLGRRSADCFWRFRDLPQAPAWWKRMSASARPGRAWTELCADALWPGWMRRALPWAASGLQASPSCAGCACHDSQQSASSSWLPWCGLQPPLWHGGRAKDASSVPNAADGARCTHFAGRELRLEEGAKSTPSTDFPSRFNSSEAPQPHAPQ